MDFTASDSYDFKLIAPPRELAKLVNTFFEVKTSVAQLDEVMPAYSAQIFIYVEGSGALHVPDDKTYRSETLTCTAPLLRAAPFVIEGPAVMYGASLTPLGWQGLSGLPAHEVNNCTVPSEQVFGKADRAAILKAVEGCRTGDSEAQDVLDKLSKPLLASRRNLDPDHVKFVDQVTQWLSSNLNPELKTFYESVPMSERTAQRLTKRYYGVSPSFLLKRYRAIRAAMLLANPELPEEMRNEILSVYFDQAHLIRDIRRYTGRTPTALKAESMLQDTLDPRAHGEAARLLR